MSFLFLDASSTLVLTLFWSDGDNDLLLKKLFHFRAGLSQRPFLKMSSVQKFARLSCNENSSRLLRNQGQKPGRKHLQDHYYDFLKNNLFSLKGPKLKLMSFELIS